jgi:hypothetical protein
MILPSFLSFGKERDLLVLDSLSERCICLGRGSYIKFEREFDLNSETAGCFQIVLGSTAWFPPAGGRYPR